MKVDIWQVLVIASIVWVVGYTLLHMTRSANYFYVVSRMVKKMQLIATTKECDAQEFVTYAEMVKTVIEKGPRYYTYKLWIWTEHQYLGVK